MKSQQTSDIWWLSKVKHWGGGWRKIRGILFLSVFFFLKHGVSQHCLSQLSLASQARIAQTCCDVRRWRWSNSKVSQASLTVDVIGELPVFPNKYESTSPFQQKWRQTESQLCHKAAWITCCLNYYNDDCSSNFSHIQIWLSLFVVLISVMTDLKHFPGWEISQFQCNQFLPKISNPLQVVFIRTQSPSLKENAFYHLILISVKCQHEHIIK